MADQPPITPAAPSAPAAPPEQTLFRGSPSLVIVFGPLLIALVFLAGFVFLGFKFSPWYHLGAALALIYIVARILAVKARYYELTTERIRVRRGILTKRTDELELYRVKDATLIEPFFYRLFGTGNIQITTTDASTPNLLIEAVHGAAGLRESLRQSIETCRLQKRVRLTELE